MTKPTMLNFKLIARELPLKFSLGAANKLNEKEWMGKEPRSCKIKGFKQKQPVTIDEYAEFEVLVEHKPKGCLAFAGNGWVWDGWTLKHIDVTMPDSETLLNGKGEPLPAGENPVFLSWRAYEDIDFNQYDFGKFIGEEECEGSSGL